MVPLSLILRKINVSYEWGKKEYQLNHLLLMDDLKLFSKSEEQMDKLVKTAHVFNTDIAVQFGMKKCGNLIMKIGKNKIRATNAWAVAVFRLSRYGAKIL